MKRRLIALLAIPVAAVATLPRTHAAADTAPTVPFDAYIAGGDASCVELTVATGFSFIVEPDARLPRATATISEGTSGALASPADPGDSVDALMGLLVPREEGQITSQMPQGTGQQLQKLVNPVNPDLEYQYEHANAQYPNAQAPGDQEATFLGAPNASFTDPSGLVHLDGTSGDAKAGATYASAVSGAGAGTSLPMLGVSVGHVTGSSTASVTSTAVSSVQQCNLQDVTIAPPTSGLTLHIGSLIASLRTTRPLNGSGASSTHSFELGDVTVNGRNLLPTGQGGIPIPPTTITFPQPPTIPGAPPPPASLRSVSITGTTANNKQTANNNEASSTLTAATVVISTTSPVPSSIPPNPKQSPISTTPVVYTLQLANLDSQTYGLPSAGPLGSGGSGGVSGLAQGGALSGGANAFPGSHGSSVNIPGTPGSPGSGGGKPVASSVLIPGTPGSLRWGVIALAAALESLLLGSLYMRRRTLGIRAPDASPSSFLDLP